MTFLLAVRHAFGLYFISLQVLLFSSFIVFKRLQLPSENGGNVCSRCFVFSPVLTAASLAASMGTTNLCTTL